MKKRIGCAQFAAVNGDIPANLEKIESLAREGAGDGVELVVFPELAVTGYIRPEKIVSFVEPIPGPVTQRLCDIAREHNVALAVGLAEKDEAEGVNYNTMLFIDAKGQEVSRYRKVHLWDTERVWAVPGKDFPVEAWEEVPVGMWICYDSRFPEAARSIAKGGGKLALVATAWLGPAPEWELAIRSRAMDNGIFVAGSALLGPDFHGVSLIANPHGQVLAQGREGEDMVVAADIELEVAEKFLARVPLLDHLRQDAYR